MIKTILIAAVIIGSMHSVEALHFVVQSQPVVPVTLEYGPHERNVLDLWRSAGVGPRPLLIYIHGGGWTAGDKSQIDGRVNIDFWLAKGVSVASINYRYSSSAILPAPVHDAARAVQFLRYKATELQIDPSRIALQGGSAGGCSALWILFHDDLADPSASDPVLQQSTRVSGVYGQFPQTSIHPVTLTNWIGELAASHAMIYKSVGAASYTDMVNNLSQYEALLNEFSPINHMDANDPPFFLTYPDDMTLPPATAAAAIHHGMFGVKLKERAEEIGYKKVDLLIKGTSAPVHYANADAFLTAVLLGTK
jgi:acetyl esterase/lipase